MPVYRVSQDDLRHMPSRRESSITLKNNLIEDGFLAQTRADELSAGRSARVFVIEEVRDVTAEITAKLDD